MHIISLDEELYAMIKEPRVKVGTKHKLREFKQPERRSRKIAGNGSVLPRGQRDQELAL
ncbi:hypothetical protein K523DRAFT_324842 [Schizophyllum commune Tattone D]|nr:hypothetical protein K523DRAFT_324842 [Schizophyllum commune Tattone D]